jgi:hypothetical protein
MIPRVIASGNGAYSMATAETLAGKDRWSGACLLGLMALMAVVALAIDERFARGGE